MGRKSKRRGGKSKRGGNRPSPSPNNNAHGKIPDDLISLCQITKAFGTLMLAEMGHVEDEKDSSIVYAEENAGELFVDGGETFFRRLKEATDKVKLKEKKRNEINDGDTDNQTMDKVQNDRRIEKGSPPIPESEAFHNTIVDDELFQPRPPRPDCPICFLPLPARNECCYQPCCGKTLCDGCIFAHRDARYELGVESCCPFCRDSVATTDTERLKKTEERLKHGDCEAYYMLGARYLEGMPPLKQDTKKGLELMNQAAELGSMAAHHSLGIVHGFGKGREVKRDEKKGLYHLRIAAIGGMLESRYLLGEVYRRRNPKLAYKHFLISAEAGHDESLKEVKTGYAEGHVEKDVFEKVLRAHKAAKNEVHSEARDKAAEWYRRQGAGKK